MSKQFSNIKKGFMLIEGLTVVFIFALVTVTFYSVFSVGTRYIQDVKNRLGAVSVANERMEIVRNLKYDDIGTVGGSVSGSIPQDQDVIENNRPYHIHTGVFYVDDPFDGKGYADTVWFEDYKKVIMTISWSGVNNYQEVELVSRFSPLGKEVPHPGDGILSVNIFSDQPGGAGIPNSRVQVVNSSTGLNTYQETDSTGNATFMGSTVGNSIQGYQITVTKSGYETVNTMPPYPTTAYNPIDVHASVVTGTMNVANIVQNELANIKISTVNYLDEPIASATFHLVGGRKLGDSAISPFAPVYNLDQDSLTNASGEKLFSSISPGGYVFSLINSTLSDNEIIHITPAAQFSLLSADGTLNVNVKLASKTATSLLVTVLNAIDDTPIVGSVAKLTNSPEAYDAELETASDGNVFFPVSSDPFLPGSYHLKITADGFPENNSDITINANELKSVVIKL
jgi:hypothetical protein